MSGKQFLIREIYRQINAERTSLDNLPVALLVGMHAIHTTNTISDRTGISIYSNRYNVDFYK